MATHNTGEPKCPECGKKFARMASLKSHMLLHEKEENLFCTECEDAFSTKVSINISHSDLIIIIIIINYSWYIAIIYYNMILC